jgi:hypothetical protein
MKFPALAELNKTTMHRRIDNPTTMEFTSIDEEWRMINTARNGGKTINCIAIKITNKMKQKSSNKIVHEEIKDRIKLDECLLTFGSAPLIFCLPSKNPEIETYSSNFIFLWA